MKPSIPKGTRDFLPLEMARRNYIFDTIKSVFYCYGFKQIETPAMENLSTLLGKYGEEGDKLLFKIINSGDYLSKVSEEDLVKKESNKLLSKISEKGLRYDLTVPFARFVVQNRDKITFPFRRFQIQPVWRADRPQKGRYREFFQCDADVIGSDSLINEVELLEIIDSVFGKLNINVVIKLNNRKVLAGIAEFIGENDRIVDITIAIDKLDKIGLDNVNKELREKGISEDAIEKLQPILFLKGSNSEKLASLEQILATSEIGLKGIEELKEVIGRYSNSISDSDKHSAVDLDLTLARGLNYYTGTIIEVKALDVEIGSITGGGRYDNLTGVFGMQGVSGVGISFGADRIYDVLNQLDGYPDSNLYGTQVLFVAFDDKGIEFALPIVKKLRLSGVNTEIYPEFAKMKKQMSYADSNNIPFVAIIGDNEIDQNSVMLKNMKTGEQSLVSVNDLASKF